MQSFVHTLIHLKYAIGIFSQWHTLTFTFFASLLISNLGVSATPPETLITNTITANFNLEGTPTSVNSSASLTTASRTPSIITFHHISSTGNPVPLPEASYNSDQDGGKVFNPITNLSLPDGSPISLPNNYPIEETSIYVASEPIVIQVQDLDQNINPLVRETIFVTISVPETGDTEVILLTETEPSSGIFRGAIQSSATGTPQIFDGIVHVEKDAKIQVNYQDELDQTDISATAALIDPSQFMTVSKKAAVKTASIGDIIKYTVSINTNGLTNDQLNLTIRDTLPPGFRYVSNSARLNDTNLPDSQINQQARRLIFNLGDMPRDSVWQLSYRALIGAGASSSEAINEAQAFSDNSISSVARAEIRLIDELMRDTSILTGRVFIGCEQKQSIPIKDARIYLETGRVAQTDEHGFWHLEGVKPGNHVVKLDEESLPIGVTPISCKQNTQFAGDHTSQFVDLKRGSLWRVDFHVQGKLESTSNSQNHQKEISEITQENPLEQFDKFFVTETEPGFKILWPPKNHVPSVASTDVAIQHSPKHKIEVSLNNKLVDALNYDGSVTNTAKTVRVSRFRGIDIDIRNRDNTLKVVLKDKSGQTLETLSRNIHFSSIPATIDILTDESTLVADGKTLPEIVISVKDQEGYPMRKNTHGYFVVEDGDYQIDDKRTQRVDLNLGDTFGQHKYYIDETGIARIHLKPTTQTGEVRLRFFLENNRSIVERVWLQPHLRKEWLLVGIAEGTIGYNKVTGNLQTLNDREIEKETYTKGRIALFAKGRIKGEYLLTLAYDSAKETTDPGEQLQGNIDPEAFYTVYGDRSFNQYEATSSKKLYLKLEKKQFYFLFGDYRTNLSVTELSEYKRTLNGIHSEYHGNKYRANLSASYTTQKHQRDEIPGDGTSGKYYLTQDIVPNSETIILETRHRFRSEETVSQRLLAQHEDYIIDYDDGSLFFKFPIPSRDEKLNPNFIIANYETESNQQRTLTAAGRMAYLSDDGNTETGLTFIHEEQDSNGDGGDLIGIDVTHKIGNSIELKGEYAQSDTNTKDSAWLLQAESAGTKLTGKAYIRQQDSNFGLGHQNLSEKGTKKAGIEGIYRFKDSLSIKGEIYRQTNLDNGNNRRQASIEAEKRFSEGQMTLGIRQTRENVADELRGGTLATIGASMTPDNGRLTLRSHVEKNINTLDSGDAEAYPDRLIIGADVGITDGIALFLEREIAKGDQLDATTDRIGLTSKLWDGATVRTSVDQESAVYGERTFANLGLAQRLTLSENYTADISIDHAKTLRASGDLTDNSTATNTVDQNQPAVSGALRDDYSAFSVGLSYRDNDWGWSQRLELRHGDLEDKMNLRFGLLRNIGEGKDISASLTLTDSEDSNGFKEERSELSLGSAWHPMDSKYTFLQRLDFKQEKNIDTESTNKTRKFIHNFHLNKQISSTTQASLHHGIKHTIDTEFGREYESTIDTSLFQIKRDLSDKWDLGLHAGYLRSWDLDTTEYAYGASVGMSPRKNMWLSLGYNFEGFSDRDFDSAEYTAEGPFIQIRLKADKDLFGLRRQKKEQLPLPCDDETCDDEVKGRD